jgi:hypothetical protein
MGHIKNVSAEVVLVDNNKILQILDLPTTKRSLIVLKIHLGDEFDSIAV